MARNFQRNDRGFVEVYTDGACSANGRPDAEGGIGVYFGDDHPLNVSRPISDGRHPTNIRAEIEAVTEAARQATSAGVDKLKIHTDCEFVIKSNTEWMPKWERNGWKTAEGNDVINRQELVEMKNALEPLDVEWSHVRGHTRVHGNEMADKFARNGAAGGRRWK